MFDGTRGDASICDFGTVKTLEVPPDASGAPEFEVPFTTFSSVWYVGATHDENDEND